MATRTVAIPTYQDEVAPCFEAARTFVIVTLEGGRIVSQKIVRSSGCKAFGNLLLLREQAVDTLICNGIKAFFRDAIAASNIAVWAPFGGSIDVVLKSFLDGSLASPAEKVEEATNPPIPLADLICWTKELFQAHGYRVQEPDETDTFPIDLHAEIDCPVCHRPVRIAICCGAHTYRYLQEIAELKRVAGSNYNARVYVRPATPQVETSCRDYGIELIDPNARFANTDHPSTGRLPILQQLVEGHEKASGGEIPTE